MLVPQHLLIQNNVSSFCKKFVIKSAINAGFCDRKVHATLLKELQGICSDAVLDAEFLRKKKLYKLRANVRLNQRRGKSNVNIVDSAEGCFTVKGNVAPQRGAAEAAPAHDVPQRVPAHVALQSGATAVPAHVAPQRGATADV